MIMLGTFMSMLCCVVLLLWVVYLGNSDFKIHNGSENSKVNNN